MDTSLEGKTVSSGQYVMSQQNVRYECHVTPWRKPEKSLLKLQKRIYRASKCNDIKKMRNLQKLLLNSTSARMLAVRTFAQDNRGKKTTGIDGKANLNQKEGLILANSLDINVFGELALSVLVISVNVFILAKSQQRAW